MDKKDIATRFSRYAKFYDSFSDIQREICLQLINEIKVEPQDICCSSKKYKVLVEPEQKGNSHIIQDILEIGCGTGFYTKLLKERFPASKIVSLDISEEMVKIARKSVRESLFFVADGEETGIKRRFDLITGSSCFQWFFNLRESLFQYKGILKKSGKILFSIFGNDTFQELREIVGMPSGLILKNDLTEIMKEFNGSLREERRVEEYPSLFFLLKKIKYSGEGMKIRDGLWTKSVIENLEEAYKSRFGKIIATYQIFFCKCFLQGARKHKGSGYARTKRKNIK